MTVRRIRKRPVEVTAVKWEGNNKGDIAEFVDAAHLSFESGRSDEFAVQVYNDLEKQWLSVPVGHFIIKGVQGEFYPCDADVLAATYEFLDGAAVAENQGTLLGDPTEG